VPPVLMHDAILHLGHGIYASEYPSSRSFARFVLQMHSHVLHPHCTAQPYTVMLYMLGRSLLRKRVKLSVADN